MAGSHRAQRGGGRAAAREARRQKARKRNQTIAAGIAVVVLVGGGGVAALSAFGGDKSPGSKAGNGPSDDRSSDSKLLADDKALLDSTGARLLGATGTWKITATTQGQDGPDKVFTCQSQRFADASGLRTWVRTFQNSTTKDTAVQYVEVSNDKNAAAKAYSSVVGWLSSCTVPQTQLTTSYVTNGLGDRGVIAVFAQPGGAKTRYKTVAVSLAGQATIVTEHDTVAAAPPKPDAVLATAAAGLKKICAQSGGCGTGTPTAQVSLMPYADSPGFMAAVDLPTLSQIKKPWVAVSAQTGVGTGCEKIDITKPKWSKASTFTYVTPDAGVATEFGLDDTVAKFASAKTAGTFVAGIRKNVDGCTKSVSNAKVKSTGTIATTSIKGETWRATYDTGGGKKFTYRIGIASVGAQSVYLCFPVLEDLDISDSAFNQTLTRAAERATTYK